MKGFTLMELLIVVAIMMILAEVGFSNYIFSLKKAHDAQRKSDLGTIAKGLEAFANDFGGYPSDDGAGKMIACDYTNSGMVACVWGNPLSTFPAGRSVQTYLAKLPKDPDGTHYYYYQKTTTGFYIYAALENTSDPYYKSGLTVNCGSGVLCNYQLSESGVK